MNFSNPLWKMFDFLNFFICGYSQDWDILQYYINDIHKKSSMRGMWERKKETERKAVKESKKYYFHNYLFFHIILYRYDF